MNEQFENNIVRIPAVKQNKQRIQNNTSQPNKILLKCKNISLGILKPIIASMMDTIDDALFKSADKAENNQLQTLYFDAMRETRIIRDNLEKDFITAISNKYDGLGTSNSNSTGNKRIHLDEAGLIDTDTLEQDLAINTTICKLRHQCKEPLFNLEKRMEFLLTSPNLEGSDNPVSPETLCQAFKHAAGKVELDIEIRLLIFKIFDQYFTKKIPDLYAELNGFLIEKGVLKDFNPYLMSHAQNSIPDKYLNTSNSSTKRYTEPPVQNGNSSENCVSGEQRSNFISSIEDARILTGLTSMQQGYTANLETSCASNRNILYKIKSSDIGKQLGDNGDIILDIVAMLFDYILDDPHTPDSMRALIGRLQIPVLKVALIDRTFFSKKSHPTRQLLNQISNIAVGFDDNTDNSDPLFAKVESIIQTILETFDDDIRLFSQLLDDLRTFKESEFENTEKRARKTVQLVEGQEKIEVARGTANSEVTQRVNDCSKNGIVSNFIKKHWKNLLLLIYAREGQNSDAWHAAIETMDHLIWSIKPKNSAEERQKLMLLQPELLEKLRQGMNRLSVPCFECDQFIAELRQIHGRTALSESSGTGQTNNNTTETETAPEENDMTIVTQKTTAGITEIKDKYYDFASTITVGTWVKFRNSDSESTRAKCSWVSPITGTILFTDRTGRKIESLTRVEFSDRLRTLRTIIIDDTPVLDRAVSCTIKNNP